MVRKSRILLAGLIVVCALDTPVSAAITLAKFVPCDLMDLTRVGTIDWVAYTVANSERKKLAAHDFKKGGAGIDRGLGVDGSIEKVEATRWTTAGWAWTDGSKQAAFAWRNNDSSEAGSRVWIGRGSALVVRFAGDAAGKPRQAHLILRVDGSIQIVAIQGQQKETVAKFSGKKVGIAVVRFDGNQPLQLRIENPDAKPQVVRGFAAALGAPNDWESGVPRPPTRQEATLQQAERIGAIDYLKVAEDFARCMIQHGRDRYGKVKSPLFAVLLTREKEPRIGPQPLFAEPDRVGNNPVFNRFDFNRCTNYPGGLGGEGPHKVTVFGADLHEDRALYEMLIDLSRITGKPEYADASNQAIRWWFTQTQSPKTGLYPWGEHLGWDFEFECPTYFEGPSKHLYAACYHEIKDKVAFLDHLAAIPAQKPGERTPLERYALGIWQWHYWDKERAIYCRHADYTGEDKRHGSPAGFPAHQAAHLQVWAKAYATTKDPEVRQQMKRILTTVTAVQTARARKYGCIPFTFETDLEGGKVKKSPQSDRCGVGALKAMAMLGDANPKLSARLREMAVAILGQEEAKQFASDLHREASGDTKPVDRSGKPATRLPDLSEATKPEQFARAIRDSLANYQQYNDPAFLDNAESCARMAYVLFMDDLCPLPKARLGSRHKTPSGDQFPDFYFRGAGLMHAFALLAEAQAKGRD